MFAPWVSKEVYGTWGWATQEESKQGPELQPYQQDKSLTRKAMRGALKTRETPIASPGK